MPLRGAFESETGQSIPDKKPLPNWDFPRYTVTDCRLRRGSIDSAGGRAYPCRPFCGRLRKNARKHRKQEHETYVSAQQSEARTHAWLPRPHGDQGRPFGPQAAPRQGSREAHAVIKPSARHAAQSSPRLEPSSSFRFRRHNRLLTAAAFGRVFEHANRSRDRYFTVLSRENDGAAARLGLAISKKHCRKSTSRNTLKRIVRESFRQHQGEIQGLDIVVINQPAATSATRQQLLDSLAGHWRRCRLRNSDGRGQE